MRTRLHWTWSAKRFEASLNAFPRFFSSVRLWGLLFEAALLASHQASAVNCARRDVSLWPSIAAML